VVPEGAGWAPASTYTPSTPQMTPTEISTPGPAAVIIKAPSDVKVKVNGQATALESNEQRFRTPTLQADQLYSYEVVATTTVDGKEFSLTRKVFVRAGQESRVDFSDIVAVARQQKSTEPAQAVTSR
jgi:uncharacterized protein (TIGR03000 family)